MISRRLILTVLACVFSRFAAGQVVTECPPNIGFETGDFSNWDAYVGEMSITGPNIPDQRRPSELTLALVGPTNDQHTIIERSDQVDHYGKFSLNSPNGSDYVVKLGNDCGGRGAERISYVVDVPAGVDSYSIVFNYAVVFQNPGHDPDEQPSFTVDVVDLTTNSQTSCGSFKFVAEGFLPGFLVSDEESLCTRPATTYYKPWSPVFVNLSEYAGRKVRLDFTTNDCSRGGHFGYAYIDFNENCSIPLRGNITCPEVTELTLSTLPGFFDYKWYNEDTQQLIGDKESVTTPVLPEGTRIRVELTPYPGLGCSQTLYTTIQRIDMNIIDPPPACASVDLTDISLKFGNSSDLTYTYWEDPDASQRLANPHDVRLGGVYYIRGQSTSGCFLVRPVQVTIIPVPPVIIRRLLENTYPGTVDLETAFIRDEDITYSFWRDAAATSELIGPDRIGRKGTYYIRSETSEGCFRISAVDVNILIPDIVVPNTFTPNGDGVNDVFTILVNSRVQITYLKIFNRWGDVVYTTPNIQDFWTGFKEGSQMPAGVYYWVLDGILDRKKYTRSGYITLLR